MSHTAARARHGLDTPGAGRWKALVFIAFAQLMVVLDATVVNIALPSVQRDLGMSDSSRQWVVTAYALAFGGLLLFGGRIADLWGRKRAFLIGLVGFAAASALGGAATDDAMMFAARALQGVSGALLAPAALSLLSVLFPAAEERARAFGVYGAIAGGGGAVGFVLGGILTECLNWRWTFFVNVPFALVATLGGHFVIREPEGGRNRSPLDIPGVILSTLGLVALVYGFTRAGTDGWGAPVTVGLFAASAVLLPAFVLTEAKVKAPLLPLRVVTDRNRGGACLSLGLANTAMFGTYLFLTYYLQVVKGYSPIRTGFAFLPMIVAMTAGSTRIAARLMARVPARLLMGPGFLTAAAGALLLPLSRSGSSYATTVLPAMLLLGLGTGTAGMSAMSPATVGVEPRDTGVASALVNTTQRVGGAIGTAVLNTIATSATTAYIRNHTVTATAGARRLDRLQGLAHGYAHALWFAVGLLGAACAVALSFVDAGRGAARE